MDDRGARTDVGPCGGVSSRVAGLSGDGGALGGGRLGIDAERGATSGRWDGVGVDIIEELSRSVSWACPFNNTDAFGVVDPSPEDIDIESRSDGAVLKLLPRPGATLLTTLGPNTLGLRSSFPFTTPLPTLAIDDVDRFASAMRPTDSGFNVSSELLGDPDSGYIPE